MGNRRKATHRGRAPETTVVVAHSVPHEVTAVLLACVSVLTILALGTFDPADASLNASGSVTVHNWIGPAGAYWSDLLLQALGVGAYALGVGLMLAAWRALIAKRILPGVREAAGTLALMVASGALADLVMGGGTRAYPAGGVVGAVLSALLVDQLAIVGAHIVASALVLMALALTADGILAGLGLRGLGAIYRLLTHVQAAYVARRERRRELAAARREQASSSAETGVEWTLGELPMGPGLRAQRREKLDEARAKGRAQAAAQIERERDAPPRRAAPRSEPQMAIDTTVDLVAEESFEMGELSLETAMADAHASPADACSHDFDDDAEAFPPDAPIAIRAASPETDAIA